MSYYHSLALLGVGTTQQEGFNVAAFNNRSPVNLYDALYNAAVGPSPAADRSAYNPGTLDAASVEADPGHELQRMQEALTDVRDMLFDDVDNGIPTSGTAITEFDKWKAWRDEASESDFLEEALQSYKEHTEPEHYLTLNRFAQDFVDINAVNGSAYVLGRAVMEMLRESDVNMKRVALQDLAVRELSGLWTAMVQAKSQIVGMQVEISKASIVAKIDEARINLDLTSIDMMWDVDVWARGGNLLGAIAGSATQDLKDLGPSKAASTLGGALMGAAGMAALGIKTGPLGGPTGIIIGGLVGGVAGLLSGR